MFFCHSLPHIYRENTANTAMEAWLLWASTQVKRHPWVEENHCFYYISLWSKNSADSVTTIKPQPKTSLHILAWKTGMLRKSSETKEPRMRIAVRPFSHPCSQFSFPVWQKPRGRLTGGMIPMILEETGSCNSFTSESCLRMPEYQTRPQLLWISVGSRF